MSPLAEILHELIGAAHAHGLPASRAEELHGLADKVEAVAGDVAEVTEPQAPEGEKL